MSTEPKRARLTAREGAMMMRLAAKEAEISDIQSYALDFALSKTPSVEFTRQHFTDSAVNVEFHLLRLQLIAMEQKLRVAEAELSKKSQNTDNVDTERKLRNEMDALREANRDLRSGVFLNSELQAAKMQSFVAEGKLCNALKSVAVLEDQNKDLQRDIELLWAKIRILEACKSTAIEQTEEEFEAEIFKDAENKTS